MATASVRTIRLIIEECFKWANQRQVFGKNLLAQPVIRLKLAKMVANAESLQAWLEYIGYQMNKMSYRQQSKYLAGPIALLKMQCTRTEQTIADEAVQIFGGRAITQTGMGKNIEMFNRTYKFNSLLGGSEEILGDLGIRQAMRQVSIYIYIYIFVCLKLTFLTLYNVDAKRS